ncbi:MAG: prefoldin subunit alpha [Candidatus Thorarchaeota archaeon]|jgi:prefoldin alpha subunit
MTEDPQALFQKLYSEQQRADQNIGYLQQSLELVQMSLNSFRSGLSVLQEIEGKEEDEIMLLNVGGAIFIEAKLSNPNKITRGIGSGVRIEQTLAEAKETVESRVLELEKQLDSLQVEFEKMSTYASKLNTQLQQLATIIQQPQQEPQGE